MKRVKVSINLLIVGRQEHVAFHLAAIFTKMVEIVVCVRGESFAIWMGQSRRSEAAAASSQYCPIVVPLELVLERARRYMVLHAAVVELFNDPVLTALDSGFVAAALAGYYELVMGV